jgi:hypothetical protein
MQGRVFQVWVSSWLFVLDKLAFCAIIDPAPILHALGMLG